jgi:hypothetical protein
MALLGLGLSTPFLLRHIGFFRVRRVELVGVRYLAPDSVLAALKLRPRQNIFDDNAEIARRAESLAGVVTASVDRKLPGTLRVSILERIPVAFTPGPDRLVAVDGDGRPLPYNPAATGLDLPLVPRADSILIRTLAAIRLNDSALFQDVDAARRAAGTGVMLQLADRRVLLSGIPAPEDVRAVGTVRRHLASTGRKYAELDSRFQGWVIVRRATT